MRTPHLCWLAVFFLTPSLAFAQGAKLPIQQAIEAQYPTTKPTADHKDMVTAGAVIDLLKDNLIMYGTDSAVAAKATYRNGKFEYGGISKLQNINNRFSKFGAPHASSNRTFVAGEKFWLIGVDVRDEGAVLEFLSDPISDVRYKAYVTYPFPAGTIPAPEVVLQQVKETIKAEPFDKPSGANNQAAQQSNSAPAAPAPMADIPPPPPPADAPAAAPKSISLGQTKDQVSATFGPPTKVVTLGTKEIDYYADMKVTFVNGKVSDVQ
jgi:hypothetical protein